MEWDVKTRHLRDWVLDEHASEEEIHDGLEGEDIAPEGDWIVHTLVLRHDMTVELELPADLSINEATRLGWLLSSAAFDDEHFAPDEMIERTHYIRPNLPISIDLPADLTEEEAHRLQTFAEILLHKGENHT
ncbi:MAG: hypothetical protein C0462_04470 [Alcanivorax sp.]|nr:hypothetical protein [Alcanivorax sp.]